MGKRPVAAVVAIILLETRSYTQRNLYASTKISSLRGTLDHALQKDVSIAKFGLPKTLNPFLEKKNFGGNFFISFSLIALEGVFSFSAWFVYY